MISVNRSPSLPTCFSAFAAMAMLIALPSAAHSPGAHVHGEAQAAIVIDGETVSITLTSAMYNITGFERPAENEAEIARYEEVTTLLENGASLFALTADAGCTQTMATHSLPEQADIALQAGDHNRYRDLEANYAFLCAEPDALTGVDFSLFNLFGNLESLDVVVLDEARQIAGAVTRERTRLALDRG